MADPVYDTQCPGCGNHFKGERGLRSHQTQRFVALDCKPRAAAPKAVENLTGALVGAVFAGNSLPAHDEVFEAAEAVAMTLKSLHAYVASVRSPEQADAALAELGAAVAAATAQKES